MQEDADLDRAPADEEQGHHHHHHPGDSRPHCCRSLRMSLELESGNHTLGPLWIQYAQVAKSNSYLVAAVDGIHAGLPHTLEHEGVSGADGEQGQQVDGQEAVDDEGPLEAGRGEDLAAVRLGTKPVPRLQALVHGDGDRQKQRAWSKQDTHTISMGWFLFRFHRFSDFGFNAVDNYHQKETRVIESCSLLSSFADVLHEVRGVCVCLFVAYRSRWTRRWSEPG